MNSSDDPGVAMDQRLRERFRSRAGSADPGATAAAIMETVRSQPRVRMANVPLRMAAFGVASVVVGLVVALVVLSGPRFTTDRSVGGAPTASPSAATGVAGEVCYAQTYVAPPSVDPVELDAQIDSAGGSGRLLAEGVYAGSLEDAARAFGGTVVETFSVDRALIALDHDPASLRVFLRAIRSAEGTLVWFKGDTLRVQPCGSPAETPKPSSATPMPTGPYSPVRAMLAEPVAAADREVKVLVQEIDCHGFVSEAGRTVYRIAYSSRQIVIALAVVPLQGPSTCPLPPPAEIIVQLEEAVGGRVVVLRSLGSDSDDPPPTP